MLARKFRIRDQERIRKIISNGKLLQSVNFGVLFLEKDLQSLSNNPRFAFIISKKISKLAVERNRVKRALSEGVRKCLETIPEKFDFVFLAKKSITAKDNQEIEKEVKEFFENFLK